LIDVSTFWPSDSHRAAIQAASSQATVGASRTGCSPTTSGDDRGTSDVHDRGTIVTRPSANSSHTASGPNRRNKSASSPLRGCTGSVSCTGRVGDHGVEVDEVAVCRELRRAGQPQRALPFVVPDGVFVVDGDQLRFEMLPVPSSVDVLAILDRIMRQVGKRLARGTHDDDAPATPDPTLARTLLTGLDLPHEPTAFAPARDPPQVELAWDDPA
jgi:hypothetical protein